MDKPLYRITRDQAWFEDAFGKAEHILEKKGNGAIFCRTHQKDAELCAQRRNSELILEDKLDGGNYVLTVVRVEPYLGRLTLTRDNDVVLETDVGLAYDAPFGPDAEDVRTWHDIAIQAADEDYRRRGEEIPDTKA